MSKVIEGELIPNYKVPANLIKGVNSNYIKAQASSKMAMMYAIKVGEYLHKIKAKVPHGEWENWVQIGKSELPFSSLTQTKKYLKLAKNKALAHVVNDDETAFNLEDMNKAIANASEEEKEEAEKVVDPRLSSETNEWYTPDHILERVFSVMGDIDLDPCSDPEGNVGAANTFTQDDNGLSKEWFGRVFMNPPYGGETGEWCRYLIGQDVDQAMVLIAASTGTTYFHELLAWADAMWLGKGKLQFKPHKDSLSDGKNPTIYNVMFYKGINIEGFKDQFNDIGKVIKL